MSDNRGAPDLTGLSQLRRHLDRLHGAADLAPDLLVQDLETVYEELRVSEEEVRVQQEQIARLVSDQATEHRQHERMVAVLPVAVLTTDAHGAIRAANAAAGGLLRVPGERLVGKPVFALISSEDRPALRRQLAEGVRGSARHVVTFLRRHGTPVAVEVLLTARPGPWREVYWTLLVAGGQGADRPGAHERLTAALMRLTGVLAAADDQTALLRRAAEIVREGIDDEASVSICIGSPLSPAAIGATPGSASSAEGAQLMAGAGPTVAAYAKDETVVSEDLLVDRRWPGLGHHLPDGTRAVVAAPLSTDGEAAGALAVYLPPGRTAAAVEAAVEMLAATVASLVAEFEAKAELAHLASDLRTAMQSRAVIEQAKGIIMAERGCDEEEAFASLVRASSTTHVKLRDVARELVERVSGARSAGA
jgi:PAS domain-containing protein